MKPLRLVRPTLSNVVGANMYVIPEGMTVKAVFDLNGFGMGIPVEFKSADRFLNLAHLPSSEVWALCEVETPVPRDEATVLSVLQEILREIKRSRLSCSPPSP